MAVTHPFVSSVGQKYPTIADNAEPTSVGTVGKTLLILPKASSVRSRHGRLMPATTGAEAQAEPGSLSVPVDQSAPTAPVICTLLAGGVPTYSQNNPSSCMTAK
jgi:hypothetical protein